MKVEQLHKENAAYQNVREKQLEKKLQDADKKLALLAKREEVLKVAKARRVCRHNEPSINRELFDSTLR